MWVGRPTLPRLRAGITCVSEGISVLLASVPLRRNHKSCFCNQAVRNEVPQAFSVTHAIMEQSLIDLVPQPLLS